MDPKQSDALARVMDLVRFLRTHCPWDAAQTPRSLIPYLLEEAHEAADAITDGDDDALRAELGDLLLNLAFQVVLAGERDAFSEDDVADTVIDKMQRRHPHLFGLGEKEDWEAMKARERMDTADGEGPPPSVLHGVARGLDPLSRAHRIQDRVSGVGFDWADYRGAFEKVAEELEEVREQLELLELHKGTKAQQHEGTTAQQQQGTTAQQHKGTTAEQHEGTTAELHKGQLDEEEGEAEGSGGARGEEGAAEGLEEELGDLLFAVVNLTRLAGVHSLTALQRANAKFTRRFRALEAMAADRGLVLDAIGLEALDVLWDEVKAAERRRDAGGAAEATSQETPQAGGE